MANRNKLAWLMALALVLAATGGVAGAEDSAPPATPPEALQKELDRLRQDTSRSFQAAQKDIDALREEVARLKREVEDLRKQQPPSTRSARYAPPASGAIRLLNTYQEPVEIVVNGASYRLAPGEMRLLRGQVPGPFTYEVRGVREPVERVLAPNETFTIHVYPR